MLKSLFFGTAYGFVAVYVFSAIAIARNCDIAISAHWLLACVYAIPLAAIYGAPVGLCVALLADKFEIRVAWYVPSAFVIATIVIALLMPAERVLGNCVI